jgi:hypothetical protein
LLEKAILDDKTQFILIQIHPGNTVHPQGLICESSGYHKKKKNITLKKINEIMIATVYI